MKPSTPARAGFAGAAQARLPGAKAPIDRLRPARLRRRRATADEARRGHGGGARAVPELAPAHADREDHEHHAGQAGDQRIERRPERPLEAVQQEIADVAAEPDPVRPLLGQRPGRQVRRAGQQRERQGDHRQPGPARAAGRGSAASPTAAAPSRRSRRPARCVCLVMSARLAPNGPSGLVLGPPVAWLSEGSFGSWPHSASASASAAASRPTPSELDAAAAPAEAGAAHVGTGNRPSGHDRRVLLLQASVSTSRDSASLGGREVVHQRHPDGSGARVAPCGVGAAEIGAGQHLDRCLGPQPAGHRLAVAHVQPQEEAAIWPDIAETAGKTTVGQVELGPVQGAVCAHVPSSCHSAVAAASSGSGWTAARVAAQAGKRRQQGRIAGDEARSAGRRRWSAWRASGTPARCRTGRPARPPLRAPRPAAARV